jgi:5-methylcytosine-specific restriction endonuclease McrA
MIKIEINNISEMAIKFVARIEKSILKNKIKQEKFPDVELYYKIHEIYLCKSDLLENKHTVFQQYLQNNNIDEEGIKNKYFDYDTIIDNKQDGESHAFWLMKQLNVRTCPYCNRQYTFTVKHKNNAIKPQFDHFHPKKGKKNSYPYLALSFYNLIPSCPTCNHIKGEEMIKINPYLNEFGDNYKFVLKDKNTDKPLILSKQNIKVGFSSENENIKVFGLKELYNEHIDYVEEIIDKAQAYNSTYYDSLIQSFSGLGKTPAEIDRYIWGNYTEPSNQCKRPLSKFTRDILEQLGIKEND